MGGALRGWATLDRCSPTRMMRWDLFKRFPLLVPPSDPTASHLDFGIACGFKIDCRWNWGATSDSNNEARYFWTGGPQSDGASHIGYTAIGGIPFKSSNLPKRWGPKTKVSIGKS